LAIVPVDLVHDGLEGAISTYLWVGEEPLLVDPGPSTTLETLEAALAHQGIPLGDLRHVVLTHVHLDHAGAAGHLARAVPGLTVHVHEDGARHLADPERLVASTRRTFGDAHERLWGEVLPVPPERLRAWRPGERGPLKTLRPFHTPGHIDHHVAWLDERTGTLFAGDCMGIVLHEEAPTHPPTPPPSVDLEAWHVTLGRLLPIGPERVGVAHFGLHEDFHGRREAISEALEMLEERVRDAVEGGTVDEDARRYENDVREQQGAARPREEIDRYFDVFRAETDYRGVVRYVTRRKPEAREEAR
jgi:glyoxylase-like metal-dependent hydrolase (beta-lactamase superfamily II)